MSQVPIEGARIEDAETVAKKGQIASKVLADSIANKYIFQTQRTEVSTTVVDKDLDKKTDATLKVLADAIGSKYQFIKEKQVKDGTKTLLDNNGNVVKDSLGNPIKVDKFKTIKVNIYEFRQFKSVQITSKVDYVDYRNNQLIESFPLASEFVFENIYSTFNGDKNACESDYYQYFDQKAVPFPSNEQMVFDSGEDLKAKLKDIITRNRFRK